MLSASVLRFQHPGWMTFNVGGYEYFLEKTGAMDDARAALTAG